MNTTIEVIETATAATTAEPRVSIVIPAFNEAPNLEHLLPRLPKVHEVILVDGNSTDGTIERSVAIMPDIKVVQQTRKGKGNALICGFKAVTGDIIVMLDADGSADPDEIERYVAALTSGADFAKGTRFAKGGGSDDITALRKTGNFFLNTVANTILGTRYTDLCYGYNAFWTRILDTLALPEPSIAAREDGRMHWGDGFEIEAIINSRVALNKLKIQEVPSYEYDRMFGESNLNTFRDGFRVLNSLLKEKRSSLFPRTAKVTVTARELV
jgi:glycosyltransferase involved in cell wall biosynthesis